MFIVEKGKIFFSVIGGFCKQYTRKDEQPQKPTLLNSYAMNTTSKYLTLRQHACFKTLSEEQVEYMATHAIYETYQKGDYIFDTKDKINYVYLLDKGCIKSALEASGGKILIKDIYYDGELFGENIFSKHSTRQDYAQALLGSKVFAIPVKAFVQLLQENVAFTNSIMSLIVQRVELLDQRIASFVFKTAKDRIKDFIIAMGKRLGMRIGLNECLVQHGMSHREIAYFTDTSRQTVARVMNELKREDFIHFSIRKPSKLLIRQFQFA